MDATTKKTINLFEAAEEGLGKVLESLPVPKDLKHEGIHTKEKIVGPAPKDLGDEGVYVRGEIARIQNLCWAYRKFPVFDTSCMSRMKKQMFLNLQPEPFSKPKTKGFTGDLSVPVFAIDFYPGSPMSWDFVGPYHSARNVSLPSNLVNKNQEIIQKHVGRRYNSSPFKIQTNPPEIPSNVQKNVEKIRNRFDCIALVWEAEWVPTQVRDPLVIGRLHGHYFLLDQFDLTKMDRYIVSEFCQGTRE